MEIYTDLDKFPTLNSLKNKQLWEVPNDYFESFADRLMTRIEQEEMNPEAQFSDIPAGYFETFLERMKEKLEEETLFENATVLAKIPKKASFQDIPAGYFEHLTEEVVASIEKEDLRVAAPVLHSLPKKIAYSDIPTDYFVQFPHHIHENVHSRKENKTIAKRISVTFAKYSRTWAGLAAMIILVMGSTFWVNRGEQPYAEHKELSFAHISNAELAVAAEVVDDFDVTTLVEELQLSSDEETDLEHISDEELSDYLKDIEVSDIQ